MFSNGDFPSCKSSNFLKTTLFPEEATSSHFFRLTDLKQQLLFRSSYFFRAAASLRSSDSERVISLQQFFFSEYLIFRSETSTEQQILENRKFTQLLFGTATFIEKELLKINISTEELLCQSRYFCIASAFSEELHFRKK